MPDKRTQRLAAIDFFCGAGGMSYGLHQAGLRVLAGIDNADDCRLTYSSNVPGAMFIKHDISTLSAPELGRRLGLNRYDDSLVFAGCSPCQFWSKVRTDRTKAAQSAFLLKHFQKFIGHFQPGFLIVENVPGLLRHKYQTPLPNFISFIERHGYVWDDGIVNSRHYGVPQNRMRYLLLATRLTDRIELPPAKLDDSLTVRSFIGTANGFRRIEAGHRDNTPLMHTASALSPLNLRRIKMTKKSGGNRTSWKDDAALQINAYRDNDDSFRDVYGRMYWDRPAPTITTRFISLSNGRFGHPDENRAISLREGATLQTFPKDFTFHTSNLNHTARQIGNAVPPELARRVGQHLLTVASNG